MLGVQKVMAGGPCLAMGLVAPFFTNEKWGNTSGPLTFMAMRMTNTSSKGTFKPSSSQWQFPF